MNLKSKIEKFSKDTLSSFKYAYNGIISSVKTERNLKIHIAVMCLVIIAGIMLNISPWEWIICLILFGAVISSELINTALEIIVDIIMPYKNEKAKLAKDIAASAVFVWAIISAIIGLIIFIPKIIQYF